MLLHCGPVTWQAVVRVACDCPVSSPSVHLEGCCGGRMFDCRDVVFIVGEGEDHDIPIGIDKALVKMQREEQCILYLGPR